MMVSEQRKPLMQCLGEFFGHIVGAVRSKDDRIEISRKVEERTEGDLTLRRTTIDEIEGKREQVDDDA